jgi:DnaJ-class molecular chaperone
MAEITQLSFFNAEAARVYQRKQREAELEALMIQYIGAEATKKWHEKQRKLRAKLDAIYSQPSTPRMERVKAEIFAEVMATVKPLSNDYALLGIEPGATKREITNAYRRQARKLHPDKGGDPEAFKAMYAAYRKLLTLVKE